MKSILSQTAAQLSETERMDAELDLLIDAELPDDRRRTLLQHIASSRDGWKMLALRFLHHQVEWQAARQLLHNPVAAPSRRLSSPVRSQNYAMRWSVMKLAASVILTAGLFGLGGAYFGRESAMSVGTGNKALAVRTTPGSNASTSMTVSSPAGLSFQNSFPLPLGVPVVDSHKVPFDYPFTGFGSRKASGRVVVVPDGQNKAVAFPVEEVAAEKVY